MTEQKTWLDMVDGSGLRYNEDKISLSHIPASVYWSMMCCIYNNHTTLLHDCSLKQAMFDLAAHCQLGVCKYPGTEYGTKVMPNWVKGQYFETNLNSLQRHWEAHLTGEFYDRENGSPHLLSVAWGFMSLAHFFDFYSIYGKYDNRTWANEMIATHGSLDPVMAIYACIYQVHVYNDPIQGFEAGITGLTNSLILYSRSLTLTELDTTISGFEKRLGRF